ERVAHVQRARDVRRRQLDRERGSVRLVPGGEVTARLPQRVPERLDAGGFEALRERFGGARRGVRRACRWGRSGHVRKYLIKRRIIAAIRWVAAVPGSPARSRRSARVGGVAAAKAHDLVVHPREFLGHGARDQVADQLLERQDRKSTRL